MKPLTVMAWDTATPWCVAALVRFETDGSSVPLGRFESREAGTHSQILPATVEGLLKGAGLSPADLDLIAVGRGPGSFTGLRTGLALAKGLAMGASVPLIGLSTLDLIASSVLRGQSGRVFVAPLIDARHQQIFAGLYEAADAEGEAPARVLIEPLPLSPADLPRILLEASGGRETLLAGPAFDLLEEAFPAGFPSPLIAAPQAGPPDALELARLARFLWLNDDRALEKYPAIPMYIRQPDIRKSGIAMR